MSSKKGSKKKGGGLKRTNKCQQTSSPQATKSSGLKRSDRNAKSAPEKVKKGVTRTDKNKTSQEPVKKKGLARVDKGATSKEPEKVKAVQRRDKNAQAKEPENVKTRKIHATATKQSKSEAKQFGSGKSGKMNQTSASLGLENVKISTKKGTRDANATIKTEVKKTGITRRDANVQKSAEVKPKTKGGNKSGASAFGQSSAEAKPKTVRQAKGNKGAFSQSSATAAPTKSGLKTSSTSSNCQRKSNNIFGGGAKSVAAAPAKNTSHMQSSFQFG